MKDFGSSGPWSILTPGLSFICSNANAENAFGLIRPSQLGPLLLQALAAIPFRLIVKREPILPAIAGPEAIQLINIQLINEVGVVSGFGVRVRQNDALTGATRPSVNWSRSA